MPSPVEFVTTTDFTTGAQVGSERYQITSIVLVPLTRLTNPLHTPFAGITVVTAHPFTLIVSDVISFQDVPLTTIPVVFNTAPDNGETIVTASGGRR